ncbi:MAG TPA: hypothetical protein VFQ53_15130 [Kofleriaceae bacterium]|nr:hypothetical protein [Kofleriaceae bacterium]
MQATTFLDDEAPPRETARVRRLRFATNASILISALFVAVSLGGLLLPAAYARETTSWATQAIAQDWFDLVIAAPCIFFAASVARTNERARPVLAGFLLFAIYTFVIYAFAVHLNPLFLVYCAGLGLAVYALIALARSIHIAPAELRWRRTTAGFLVVVGVAFGLLWLGELVPAAIRGREPAALVATGLFTNPVHVLDLSFILPLHVLAGVLVWRRRALGAVLAPVVLAFGALMAASIAVLVVAEGGTAVAIAMGLVALASIALLVAAVRRA